MPDGIAARSRRGPIGATWWSKRFIAVLEGMGHGPRMSRGRGYARGGNVLDLSIRPGEVAASVQGSRRRPYSVLLKIRVYDPEQWTRVERALAGSAQYTAMLLDGRMPERIEDVFAACNLTFFPVSREFRTECSCPDMQSLCKHVAASCYILAERFDEDPFTMAAWRGRDRATLLRHIEALRDEEAWQEADGGPQDPALSELVDHYWGSTAPLPAPLPTVPPHAGPDAAAAPVGAILDRLGPAGVEVEGRDIRDLLRPAYQALAGRS